MAVSKAILPTNPSVGFFFPEKKLKKQRISSLLEFLRQNGCTVTALNLSGSVPLEEQGPFDVILHKLTDTLVAARCGDSEASETLRRLQAWKNATSMTWIDPLEHIEVLTDRIQTFQTTETCANAHPGLFKVPKSVVISSSISDIDTNALRSMTGHLTFPVVVKNGEACGLKHAHEMHVGYRPEDIITQLQPPLLIQELIPHDNLMLKCYVINGCVRPDIRPSINSSRNGERYSFNSQNMPKSLALSVEEATNFLNLVGHQRMQQIADVLAEHLHLSLFGFDIIVCNTISAQQMPDLYVIDVNYFPAYDGVDDFFQKVLELVQQKHDVNS